MKLNEKILIALTLFFIAVISGILVVGSTLYLEGGLRLDEQQAVSHLDNAVVVLQADQENLARILHDWAPWDDTYDYILNPEGSAYIERNLNPDTLKNIGIDLFVLTDLQGTIVWGRVYDATNNTLQPVPQELILHVHKSNRRMAAIGTEGTITGMVMTEKGPLLIGISPVIHTDFTGPVAGRLVMGSFLDKGDIARIASLSSPSVAFIPYRDAGIPAPVRERMDGVISPRYTTVISDERTIRGYAPLRDLYGEPAFFIVTSEPRTYYDQSKSVLLSGILAMLILGLLFGVLVLVLVDRYILRRLKILRDAADEIRTSGSLSGQVRLGGDDELTDVAVAFNHMIRTIRNGHQNLEASEARFRDLTDLLPQIIFEMGNDGKLTYLNKFGREMFGLEENDPASGKNAFSYLVSSDRQRAQENIALIVSGQRKTGDIYTLMKKGGGLMTAIIYAAPIIHEGALEGYRGSVIDISDLKEAEAALRESEEKYRNLAENTADVLFSLDLQGTVTYVSPQIAVYGFTAEELLGRLFAPLIHPDDRERVLNTFKGEMATGDTSSSTFRILGRTGTLFWVEERSTILRDRGGRPCGLQGVMRDVTDRKKAEDAIRHAHRKLNLLNDITRHDIINTITGLLGTIDMAKDPSMHENIDVLLADIRQLAGNIQQQIEFTREYQAVGVREPIWQHVPDLIRGAAAPLARPGITIINDVSSFEIFGDPMLEKVFYNLIQNAISYGEQTIIIRISERISDRGFAIVCEDNGIGVPAELKERIFERGIGQNTGMGLFLAREILSITGITIQENGVYGKGARFEIVIPKGGYRFRAG